MKTTWTTVAKAVAGLLIFGALLPAVETNRSSADGRTTPEVGPGSPAGTYALSDFDTVNLYSGNLNFALPLFTIGGRGEAGYTAMLHIERRWAFDVQIYDEPGNYHFNRRIETNLLPYRNYWLTQFTPPRYSPGFVAVRQAGRGCNPAFPSWDTVTRINFIAADGTEHELVDQNSGGEPYGISNCGETSPLASHSRGKYFVSRDGSGISFQSDLEVIEYTLSAITSGGTGWLLFPNGVRYRVVNGLITIIRDRNGNETQLQYSAGPFENLQTVTDSSGRITTFSYNTTSDTINFTGANNTPRALTVNYANLDATLETGFSIQPWNSLFSGYDTVGSFDPQVISSVQLPNSQSYSFKYNDYGELARITVPTGGVIRYAHGPGWPGHPNDATSGGNIVSSNASGGGSPELAYESVYRRVISRETYPDGSTLMGRTTYSVDHPAIQEYNLWSRTVVTVDRLSRNSQGAMVSVGQDKHYFWGGANTANNYYYTWYDITSASLMNNHWRSGREFKTEHYGPGGTGLLRTELEDNWLLRSCVSPEVCYAGYGSGAWPAAIDPRLTIAQQTLENGDQSTQIIDYDQFNNKTDIREYEGSTLKRRTHTDFKSAGYVFSATTAEFSVNLRRLPTRTTVYADETTSFVSDTQLFYDYENQNGLSPTPRSSPSGYTQPGTVRGNLTQTKKWVAGSNYIEESKAYDELGNPVSLTDARSQPTLIRYDDCFTTATTLGTKFSYAYPTSVTNPASLETTSCYDYSLGRASWVKEPVGPSSAPASKINETRFYYGDALDRLTQVTSAFGQPELAVTDYQYDAPSANWLTTLTDLDGTNRSKSETRFDGFGRTVEQRTYESAGSYVAVQTQFDGQGQVSAKSNPYRNGDTIYWTTTEYDALGRVKRVAAPDNSATVHDYVGRRIEITDASSNKTWQVYDAVGRLVQVTNDPYGNAYPTGTQATTTYEYDALDRLRKVIQPGQPDRVFQYDGVGRLTSATNPESGTITYTSYDANGNLLSKQDARGIVTTFAAYDVLNRPTSVSYSDGTPSVQWLWDTIRVGSLTSITNSNSTRLFQAYDTLGRPTATRQDTVAPVARSDVFNNYAYNKQGTLTSETYPSGRVVSYSGFDLMGRPTAVTGYASGIQYASHGAIKSITLGNNLIEKTDYSADRLQPTWIRLGTAALQASVSSFNLYWCPSQQSSCTTNDGNLRSQTIAGQSTPTLTQTYTYDPISRLKTFVEGTVTQTYGYDRYGNRWVEPGSFFPAGTSTATPTGITAFDANTNRLVSSFASYDLAGNMQAAQGAPFTYTYDAENRVIAATSPSNGSASYAYDGEGRRVRQMTCSGNTACTGASAGLQTTVYVYDAAGQLAAEYGTAPITNPGRQYLTADHLGSTRVITDSAGSLVERLDYLPFGEGLAAGVNGRSSISPTYNAGAYPSTSPDGQSIKFTGHLRDAETGLDFMQARYMSNAQGRFISPDDPFADQQAEDPQRWNLYSYSRNDPLRYTDPDGHGIVDWLKNQACDAGFTSQCVDQQKAPPVRSDSNDQKAKLVNAQNDAMANPDFDRSPNGQTHCNAATCAVVKAVGGPTGPLTDSKGNLVNANQQAKNLASSGQYREVTKEEAQRIADGGGLVVVAWSNPSGPGHTSTVRPQNVPGDAPRSGGKGPLLNDIGAFHRVQNENYAFRKTAIPEVHYYAPKR